MGTITRASQANRRRSDVGPVRCVEIDLVGSIGAHRVLDRVVGSAKTGHQLDLLLGPQTPPTPSSPSTTTPGLSESSW
ncbi:hypothetical protein [Streptomyces sp. NPDC020965]|uniref:hypothetical protein n=1 Tax=Streptomyces sp. NPDC020965 TaxID=3365105 RepID=UPI00378E82FC